MKHFIILLLCVYYFPGLKGQNVLFEQTQSEHASLQPVSINLFHTAKNLGIREMQFVTEGVTLQLDEGALETFFQSAPKTASIQLPYPLSTTLDLVQSEVFSHDFILQTSEGKTYDFDDEIIFYRGHIKKNPNSVVAVSVVKDEILIMYSDKEGNKRIQKTQDNTYLAFEDKNIRDKTEFTCGVNDEGSETDLPKDEIAGGVRYTTEECATVFVVCDYKSYQDNGSDLRQTYLWVAKLWNEVVTLFQNEQIPVRVSSMLIYTSAAADPFDEINNANTILDNFTALFPHNNPTLFKHLMSTRYGLYVLNENNQPVTIVGLARRVNSNCDNLPAYCNSNYHALSNELVVANVANFPNFSQDVHTIAHEMGHNLGSHHTFSCCWPGGPIDNCWLGPEKCGNQSCPPGPTTNNGGTIMSYCQVNFSLGFGQKPGNKVRCNYNNLRNNCNIGTCLTVGDRCVSAVDLPCGSSIQGTNQYASWDAPPDCGPEMHGPGVWYKFTGNGQNTIISTCSAYTFNTMISVYRGTNCNNLICVAGNDDYCVQGSQVAFSTTNGTFYYVLVQGSGTGNFTITRTCSTGANVNDHCSGAIPLACGQSISDNTYWATIDADVNYCSQFISGPGVWYKFTGNGQNNIISTCPPANTFFSRISVYKNACGELLCVTSNNGYCYPGSRVSFFAQSGEEYFVLVHGTYNQRGDFTIQRTCIPQPPGDLCSNAIPLNCGASLNGSTLNASDDWESGLCGNLSSPVPPSSITPGMWYTFVGNGQNTTISSCSDTDFFSRIIAFKGDCSNLDCLGQGIGDCSNNSSGDKITIPTISGETYFILVEGYYIQGTFTIDRSCFEPPPGDLCTTSILIPCNDTLSGSILQAAIDPDVPGCGYSSSPGIWYKIIGHGENSWVSTCPQYNYNTRITVYDGSCENLSCVGSNNNYCGEGSQIAFPTETDSMYYIHVTGVGEQGNHNLSHVCFTPLNGDDCITALNLPADTIIFGNTTLASVDVNGCLNSNPNPTGIWYTFIGDGLVNEIFVNGYNTLNSQFSILSGTCNDMECVGIGNDYSSNNSFTSIITQPGIVYYVLVYGANSQGIYSIKRTSRISSDVCISALQLACGDTLSGSTVNTTIDNNLLSCNGLSIQAPGVWYKIVGNGQVNEISLCSGFTYNTRLSVYKNNHNYINTNCNDTMVCVTSNDNFCGDGSKVSFPTRIGVTYYIVVHGTSGATGNFNITRTCITTPGDNCSIALNLTCGDTLNGSTIGALYDAGSPVCENVYSGQGGIWYTFTGNNLNNVISTCTAADFDTRILVYQGSCDSLSCVASNENYCTDRSLVNFFAENGVQYFVLIDGAVDFDTIGQGTFTITRQCYMPPVNDFCSGATQINCGENLSGSLSSAGPDNHVTNCGNLNETGVWYKIIGNGNNTFLSFTGTTLKKIYTGSCGQMNCLGTYGSSNNISFTTQVDSIYYIYIYQWSGSSNNFTVTRSCSAPVSNDNCVNAANLPCGTDINGTTNGAASDTEYQLYSQVCEKSINTPGVWYKFTGNGQNMLIYTCNTGSFFTDITVFQNSCDSFICVGDEAEYYYCNNGSKLSITTQNGTEYYILVHGYNSVTGNFTIRRNCTNAIAGDKCDNAINITCGQTLSGTTAGKPYQNPEIQHCLADDITRMPGVWYTFTGNGQVAKLSTCTTNGIHHNIHVYNYDCSNLGCREYSSYCSVNPDGSEVEFLTSNGLQYYVFIESNYYADPGAYSLTYTCTTPAPGTTCSGAESLSCGQTIEGDLFESWFIEPNEVPFCGYPVNSRARWYTFTGDGDNTIISTCETGNQTNDTAISIYTGDCDSLVCYVFNNDGCGVQSRVSFTTEENVQYYVLVYRGDDEEGGTFEITRSCANDNCMFAFDLSCGTVDPGNTTYAAPSLNLPACGIPVTSPGVWYKFTGDGQNTRISTCNFHNFDTRLDVYTGTCDNLVCHENNNDYCSFGSQVYFNTIAGTQYYVFVHGNGTSDGNFMIERSCDSDTFYCQSAGIHPTVSPVSYFGINDSLVGSDIASYTFYNQDTILISRGGNSEIQIVNFEPGLGFYKIWIDFNRNGDFTDENELVTSFYSTDSLVIDTILIPQNISKGITRLRLIKNLWEWPSSPCEIFNFGEVEDYLVDIRCNLVTTTIDAGSGSLRSVANCVDDGEYVLFAPSLNGQEIQLTNGPIQVQGDWKWKADSLSNITISGENTTRVLFVPADKSLELENLKFIGGTLSNGCVVENRGNLKLINCSMENINQVNVSTLLNKGILNIFGFCTIE